MSSFVESWIARLLFSMISLIAFLGNTLVIWVFVKQRKTYSQNAFDIFIVNLAVSDVLGAIFLVFSRFLYLPAMPNSQPEAFLLCSILWGGYILFGLGYVSVYTCLVLTIERWFAVIKPHAYRSLKKKHAILAIVIVWFWGFFINLPVFISIKENFEQRKCEWIGPKRGKSVLPVLEIFFTCILPFSAIIILYVHIFYKINRMPLFLGGAGGTIKKRLTVIALVASVVLIIGWLPTQISYTLRYIGRGEVHLEGTAHYFFIMMTLANSCINPILYGVYSSRFRKEYSLIICGIFGRTIPCGKVADSEVPPPAPLENNSPRV